MSLSARAVSLVRGGRWLARDIGFDVPAGTALLVEGGNGCGKSTLLRTLCGLVPPHEGGLWWRGEPLPSAKAALGGALAYLGHEDAVHPDLTAHENLQCLLALCAEPAGRDDVDRALAAVGLEPHRHVRARHLSQGQRRRVALARLWITERPLWVLDEPLSALDDAAGTAFRHRLQQHLQRGGMAVLTCHTHAWTATDFPLQRLRWA